MGQLGGIPTLAYRTNEFNVEKGFKPEEEKISDDTDVTRLQFGHSGPVPALEKNKTKAKKKGKKNTGITTPYGSMKNMKRGLKKKGNALNATFQVPDHSRNGDREESRL